MGPFHLAQRAHLALSTIALFGPRYLDAGSARTTDRTPVSPITVGNTYTVRVKSCMAATATFLLNSRGAHNSSSTSDALSTDGSRLSKRPSKGRVGAKTSFRRDLSLCSRLKELLRTRGPEAVFTLPFDGLLRMRSKTEQDFAAPVSRGGPRVEAALFKPICAY